MTLDVLADGDLQRTRCCVLDDVAEQYRLPGSIRHLDADVIGTGNGREDAHAGRGERQRDIVFKRGNAADAHSCRKIHFEQGDRWTRNPAHHFGHDIEVFKRFLQASTGFLQLRIGC